MNISTSQKKAKILAYFTAIYMLLPLAMPVKAEVSPDVGMMPYGDEEEVALIEETVKKEAAEAAAKKAAEEKAKKAAAAAAAAKLAAAKAAEEAKKNPPAAPVNISVAAKNAPTGLTPTIIAEALSVDPGKAAAVTVKTLPGAKCDIDVFVVNKTPVKAAGLEDKTANEEGLCSWQWTVARNTARGSWGVKILATKDGVSDDTWTVLNVGRVH